MFVQLERKTNRYSVVLVHLLINISDLCRFMMMWWGSHVMINSILTPLVTHTNFFFFSSAVSQQRAITYTHLHSSWLLLQRSAWIDFDPFTACYI